MHQNALDEWLRPSQPSSAFSSKKRSCQPPQQQRQKTPMLTNLFAANNSHNNINNSIVKSMQSTIRVFISSTFSDMARERDLIASRVAPRICKFSESLGITTTFVDLRWGVTTDQVESNDAVFVCLDQVLKSDIVLVFCGHRYGWHVCDDDDDGDDDHGGRHDGKERDERREQQQRQREVGNKRLSQSIFHAADALSNDLPWLQPVLSLARHHQLFHQHERTLGNNINDITLGKYLLRSSVTELEIRCALLMNTKGNNNNNNNKNNNNCNTNNNNVHVFLRSQSQKSQVEECCQGKSRLNSMRNALACLPTARWYANLSCKGPQTTTSNSISTSSDSQQQPHDISSVIKSASALEEEIYQAICESIFNIFPDRRQKDKQKPRKWERESQIQHVLADRSLIGFCDDF